jgi:hypothetical protein
MPDAQRALRLLASACLLATAAASVAGQFKFVGGENKLNEKAAVISYASRVDAYVKTNARRARFFANDAGNDGRDDWRELKGDGKLKATDANESASVIMRNGHVIIAWFTLQRGSRDWVHFISYYFREDGTLAKVEARLNTFYGHVTAVREKFYGERGQLLQADERFYKLGTKSRVRPNDGKEEFIDEPIPIYKSTRDLPFYRLLK